MYIIVGKIMAVLGNFRAVFQDVKIKSRASEELSPNPPTYEYKGPGEGSFRTPVNPINVIEDTNTDGFNYNEFYNIFETTGEQLGQYDVRVGDTDLAGNPGSKTDQFVLRASYGHWYNHEYNWGL